MTTPSKVPTEVGPPKLFLVPITIGLLKHGKNVEDSCELDGFDIKSVKFSGEILGFTLRTTCS